MLAKGKSEKVMMKKTLLSEICPKKLVWFKNRI